MMNDSSLQPTYSWEAYLELEQGSSLRYEYHDGEILCLAGASTTHNEIASNTYLQLRNAAKRKGCKAYLIEVKLFRWNSKAYLYPDGMVACQPLDLQAKDGIRNPLVLVEVLSPSTQYSDRGFKLREYVRIPSLQHYLIIEQGNCEVQHYFRLPNDQWGIEILTDLAQSVSIPTLNLSLSLRDIYEGIDLGSAPEWNLAEEEGAYVPQEKG